MTLVLDAGAFIALERGDVMVAALLKRERLAKRVPVTHGGIVGQVWRGGAHPTRIAFLLPAIDIGSLDEGRGRSAGALLARSGTSDVIDAALTLLINDGDELLTSDLEDFRVLSQAANVSVDLIHV
jgi:hypothetical protein